MIRTVPDDGIIAFYLDSSETKPIDYIKTGSVTFETDTQDKYFFDEVDKKWYKYTGPWLDFYTKTTDDVYCFFGLDSDTKPEGFGQGSMFVEVNTSKAYILSDEGWKEAENPGPTPPGPTPQPTLQDKTVDPTTSDQEVTCDSGYDGLGTVTITAVDPSQYYKPEVSGNIIPTTSAQVITPEAGKVFNQINVGAVTNGIDNNIQAANIKKDVTILGVVGTYEGEEPGPDTEAIEIIEAINALPDPDELTYEDADAVDIVTNRAWAYVHARITNHDKLIDCIERMNEIEIERSVQINTDTTCTFDQAPSDNRFISHGAYDNTPVTIDGINYTTGLKMEGSDTRFSMVTFETGATSTITLHVTPAKRIVVDNVGKDVNENGLVVIPNLAAGEHIIRKSSASTTLYAIKLEFN